MTDTFEITLNNPITEDQLDMITDVDFDCTDRIWFHTKHGKEVEFVKVIRCKDCKYYTGKWCTRHSNKQLDENDRITIAMNYCLYAERREE